MHLNEMETKQFFKLWLGLIKFTNVKYNMDATFGFPESPREVNIQKALPIKDKLWHEVNLIGSKEYPFWKRL